MSYYPGTEGERRAPVEALEAAARSIFERCGMEAADAGLLAGTLAWADLRGIHSHGVLRVPDYVDNLLGKGVNPRGRPRVVREVGATVVVDGGNSMGQIGSVFAMNRAIERARETGVAAAAVRGSNHCGAMAYYAVLALEHEMIGLAATNALPTMAPWGGVDKIVGINPLAVAIPAAAEHPIVLDVAFSYASHGKVRVYQQKGQPIPPNWAFDSDGRPTTDPAQAIAGLLQPIGEYKGVGLAIVMGILSSLLSGAGYGLESGNMAEGACPGKDGHFFLAVNIAAFEDPARFRERVDGVIRGIQGSRLAPGFERVYAPGGLEAEIEARYRREGVPLNDATLDGLTRAAARVGAAFDLC